MSARTKVDGFLSIRDATYFLFEHEYALPLIPYEWAAVSGTYVEHLLSVLLIFGLGSRLSAFGILSMTAIVQVFVYPSAWPTHLSWAVLACCVARWGSVVFRSLHGRKSDSAIGDLIGRLRCRIRLETNGKPGKTLASKLLCGVGLS